MNIEQALINTGLNKKQILVYLELFKAGESTPGKLAYKTNINRSSVYLLLDQLQKKGLVSQNKRKNTTYFHALHPSILLEAEKEKLLKLEEIIPELKGLKGIHKNLPEITVYEGVEEVIEMCEDSLKTKTELLSWVDISNITRHPAIEKYSKEYWKKRVERKIPSRGVWTYEPRALEYKKAAKHEQRDLVLMPKEQFPFENEIFVYDDKISILSSIDMVGILIKNKVISDMHRALFNVSFIHAKEQEKNFLSKEDWDYVNS